jgi:hypothetical protein
MTIFETLTCDMSLGPAPVDPDAGIYGDRSSLALTRHRREHADVQLRKRGSAAAPLIRRSVIILLVGFGVAASFALTRFLENFLWGVTRSDSATFLTIAAILVGTGIVACLVPGTRATRTDPFLALRHD